MSQDFVRPIKIVSPISGQPSIPKLVERRIGDKIHVEAHGYDPASGTFLRRGLVEIKDVEPEK